MQRLSIAGGHRLCGTVPIAGAKNAALPLMAAALLTDEPITLTNVPRLRDIRTMRQVLAELGVHSYRLAADALQLTAIDADCHWAGEKYVRQMRASFCVLGPLVARRGRAVVPLPGGCVLGNRPVDLHLRALEQMGAEVSLARGQVIARAPQLHGATVSMLSPRGPSVTGTANVMSAAALARGTTIIHHAAREPEIVELAVLLNGMGARIAGAGSNTIEVRGVDRLHGASHRLMPDRIEAATYLLAAIVTQGDLVLEGARAEHLLAVIDLCRELGACVECVPSGLRASMKSRPRAFVTTAAPYPGLPTDVQPLLAVAAAMAKGTSTITDTVFPHRWAHVPELARMGATFQLNDASSEPAASATGVSFLSGTTVVGRDLRAAAALVLAGLAAQGTTTVYGLNHLSRGYQQLAKNLRHLGAEICVEPTTPVPGTLVA